jgi:tetratricopeptide (TPR) repeat protein
VAGELVEALVANGPAGVPEETVAIFLSAAWEGLEQPGGAEVVRLVLDRALPRGPNTPGFMVDLGTLIGERGGWVVAEELAARALALDGSDVEALVLAARCAREGGDLATARRLLERAVDAAPGSFEACLGLVEVALAQGDRDVARHALGQAWARVPAEARALVSLGRASAALGMYGDARAAFTSAIGLDPRDPEPLVRRALAEQRLGRPEAAECDLREAFGRGEGCWAATLLMEQFARSDRVGEVERLLEEAGGPAGVAASLPCLIEPAAAFWEARGEPARAAAYRARAGAAEPPTAAHYAGLAATLATIGVPLVAVQYPGRDLAALRRLVPAEASVVLVDNGADIREAVLREGYEVIFWDHCYGDFGHGTRVGNRIIAENVAAAVRTLALEEGGSG